MEIKNMEIKDAEIMDEKPLDDLSKPVMLFGRDIRTIPCFKNSVLYGIYSGFAGGLATFLFTSRVRLATNMALVSYGGVSLTYWCFCRYNYVKDKYAIAQVQQLMQTRNLEQFLEDDEETKLEST